MLDGQNDAIRCRLARLERERRIWRAGLLALLVAAGSFGLSDLLGPKEVSARQKTAWPADPGDPKALYEEVHREGHRAIEIIDQSMKIGAPIPAAPSAVAVWSLRLLGADMYLCSLKGGPRTTEPEVYLSTATGPPDPDRERAFREHVDRMRLWEDRFRPLVPKRYLSELDFLEFRSRRVLAEAWLARELDKPAAEK